MTADGPTKIAPQKGDISETLQELRKRLESDNLPPYATEVLKSHKKENNLRDSTIEGTGYGYRRRESDALQSIGFSPLYPLVLALLPAGMSLLIGDSAGIFIADALLLVAIGWIIWSVTEGSWTIYYNRLNAAASNEPTPGSESVTIQDFNLLISLLFHFASPFIGGWILYFSRQNLSGGSKLITNFNIFLYISLELGRCINRITKHSPRNPAPTLGRLELENIGQRLSTLEEELNKVQEGLNSMVNKVSYNETAFNNELYTIWKGVDRVNRGLKTVSSIKPETNPTSPDSSLYRIKRGKKTSPQPRINQLPTVDELHETIVDHPQPPTISKLKNNMNDDRPNDVKSVNTSERKNQRSLNNISSTRQFLTFALNFSIYAFLLLPFRILARLSSRNTGRTRS